MEAAGEAEVVLPLRTKLGEGAFWDGRTGRLWWVDIVDNTVMVYNPQDGSNAVHDLRQSVGTVVPCRSSPQKAVVACSKGVGVLDTQEGKVRWLVNPESGLEYAENRFNDGKCDPQGRLWVGSMNIFCQSAVGSLYCITGDGACSRKVPDTMISNGICWSRDRTRMYYIDSPTGCVDAFDYDDATSNVTNRRTVVKIPHGTGGPDGMAIDADDNLWVAQWGGSRVAQYNPSTGDLLRWYSVPCEQVTSCAFGGPDLNQLYITTASCGLTDKAAQPKAGMLFRVDLSATGIRGVPSDLFADA